ncbi:MAG: hypothetical protein ACXABO_05800 [Promethearchaeota archaeon]|jgi:hypothetical protein
MSIVTELLRIFHLIGLSWGVGASTFALILNILSGKNAEMKPHIKKIMPYLSKFIFLGILVLGVSGIFLQGAIEFEVDNYYLSRPALIVKHVIAVVLLINGILLATKLSPKMQDLAPKEGPPSEEFTKAKKIVMISGLLNLIIWYVIIILSVLA